MTASTANIPEGFTVETVYRGDWHAFERLVKRHYGQDFDFVADEECGNDSDHRFHMPKYPLDKWEAERLAEFKATGRGTFLSRTLLQDLVNRDVIPEGTYLIQVSW